MNCGLVRDRLSAHVDGDLPPAEAGALEQHLAECLGCAERRRSLEASLAMLVELPRLVPAEPIASRVRDRLEVERRGPGLALLFRPALAGRPLILPSLVPAALVLVLIGTGVLALGGRSPSGSPREAWDALAPSGTEANPLFPSAEVTVPQVRSGGPFPETLAAGLGEGTVFVETVVARDGSVSTVTLLEGNRAQAQPLLDALRQQRFEPGRYRGRPVAVSVYRLFSRMEVRAPLT
jgi:anti-sigma factor RsiW